MKFSVERDSLLASLSHAHRIVARTDAIPIFSTVLMRAADGRVATKAMSPDLMAETSCAADIEAPGLIAVPLAPMVELLRRLPAGTPMIFAMPEGGSEISIRYRRSSLSLPVLSTDAFPAFDMPAEVVEVDVDAANLARLLETPVHVADASSPFSFGAGVHLHFSATKASLVGVAADNKRLTIVTLPAGAGAERLPPLTIAIKPAGEVVKLARDTDRDHLRLRASAALLSVSDGATTLTMKLIETQFPDYASVIPKEITILATVASADLGSALQRTLILADDRDRIVRCEISGGVLSIAARSQKSGAIQETVEVEGGEGIRFGFNARMAVEALAAIDADVIELSNGGPGQPIVMRAKANDEVLCLVMPLKV